MSVQRRNHAKLQGGASNSKNVLGGRAKTMAAVLSRSAPCQSRHRGNLRGESRDRLVSETRVQKSCLLREFLSEHPKFGEFCAFHSSEESRPP